MRNEPVLHTFQGQNATLAYYEWAGVPGAPKALLVHATGFHGRVWDQVVKHLPKDWRVLAVEMRGHGRSSKEGPFDAWEHFAQDLVELVDHLEIEDWIAAGHSMGGWAVCHTAIERPKAFKRLVLIDPTINSPEFYGIDRYPDMKGAEDHPVARRRNEWVDWQALFDRLKDREPYSFWQTQVLTDYCQHGILPNPAGPGYVLACPPIVEASVFRYSWRGAIHDRLSAITAPVTLLRALRRAHPPKGETDFIGSPTWEKLTELFPNATDVYLPDNTHFMPMEDPALVAGYIATHARTVATSPGHSRSHASGIPPG